jgi:hypothetical protein
MFQNVPQSIATAEVCTGTKLHLNDALAAFEKNEGLQCVEIRRSLSIKASMQCVL